MAQLSCIQVSCDKIGKVAISAEARDGITISSSMVCVVTYETIFFAADGKFITADGKTIILNNR